MDLRKFLIRNNFQKLYKILKKINMRYKKRIYKILYKLFKVNNNRIIFDSFLGKSYSCNPKYIYESMLKDERYKNFEYIWVFRDKKKQHIDKGIKVKYGTLKHFYFLTTSKYWVFNSKMPKYFQKKENQIYIQTWHGTPLKRLAKDIKLNDDQTFYRSNMSYDEMVKTYSNDVERYDYLISPNKYSTEKFISAFSIEEKKIIETGYPRNDKLFNHSASEVNNIKKRLNIDTNKKIILYAPTWRDNIYSVKGYEYEPKVDFELWKERLSDQFIVIYKPHYLIENKYKVDYDKFKDFLYYVDGKEDINDLYIISDVLITDYSSVFFDFICLDKPVIFYMYDLLEYKEELRGFYLNIDELPGEVVEKEEFLLEKIIKCKDIEFESNIKFKEKIGFLDDGRAFERLANEVFKA